MKIMDLARPENVSGTDKENDATPDPLRSRSAGKALQRVFRQEELHKHVEEQKASVSYLMNVNRRNLLIHLCSNPCDHVRGVARAMHLSAPAATWHLRVLCESGHLSKTYFKKRKLFWLAGMIRSRDIEMVATLRMPPAFKILTAVSGMHGKEAKESHLAAKLKMSQQNTNIWLCRLVKAGLITRDGAGPGTKYTISTSSMNSVEQYEAKAKEFSESMIEKLDIDGLKPGKARVRGTRLFVEVTLPSGKERLKFECNPLADLARILK